MKVSWRRQRFSNSLLVEMDLYLIYDMRTFSFGAWIQTLTFRIIKRFPGLGSEPGVLFFYFLSLLSWRCLVDCRHFQIVKRDLYLIFEIVNFTFWGWIRSLKLKIIKWLIGLGANPGFLLFFHFLSLYISAFPIGLNLC